MADLTSREMLQPCLLDRLTDENPRLREEGRDARVMSMRELRSAVLRDLTWLLNAQARFQNDEYDEYPDVANSVINLGLPDISGSTASGIDLVGFERTVLRAIRTFEPRVIANSLSVQMVRDDDEMSRTTISFEIRGELWAQPLPETLFVKTEVDLESGQIEIKG